MVRGNVARRRVERVDSEAPCGGTARVRPNSAPGRAAGHRAFHRMRATRTRASRASTATPAGTSSCSRTHARPVTFARAATRSGYSCTANGWSRTCSRRWRPRQYVFTLPRLLRPIFAPRRAWLGELCRIAARLLVAAYAEAAPLARPARSCSCRPSGIWLTKSKQPYDESEISFSAESAACAPSAAAVITWPVVPARTAPAAKMPRTEVSIVSLTVT